EGPIIKDKLSFIVSARRSYIDEILKPAAKWMFNLNSSIFIDSRYHFYDVNGKLTWKVNHKNMITLSYYRGNDYFRIDSNKLDMSNLMQWGNELYTLNWNYSINEKWNLFTTAGTSKYTFLLNASQLQTNVEMLSEAEDLMAKTELSRSSFSGSIIKIGAEYSHHVFKPNNIDAKTTELRLDFGSNRELRSHESTLYYNHEFDPINRLRINAGLRYVLYFHTGPYFDNNRNEIGEITDTIYYPKNQIIQTYHSPEPRIALRYQINTQSSLKASYTYNKQFTHMVSASAVTLPTDVWLPSTENIKAQSASQYTLGYFYNFDDNMYQTSINGYYKKFTNQIELLNGIINNFQDNTFEESILQGNGNSLGLELFLQKNTGRLTGWVAYTLSRTTRQFDEINDGKIYPAKYDRTHDLNIVAAYDLTEKWILSGEFILASGNALTVPSHKFIMGGNLLNGYTDKNSFRMPMYHRMDLSLTYELNKTSKYESSLNFSVYNVYNRANPFYIYFDIRGDISENNLTVKPEQVSVFPILPSISWSFKF
ncbi:MAG: TonB-dependent receptor, partial [Bacteroidales bacterium]|nr:TonB-dependent receptor [Bacteroidales bacterium]